MKRRHSVLLPTPHGGFISLLTYLTPECVEYLRSQGYDVSEVLTIIPEWAVEAGLTRFWVFCSDVFNFRWKYVLFPRS